MTDTETNILKAMAETESKALDNLARYKFSNFGYHAAMWVNYNKLLPTKKPNPFKNLVHQAQTICADKIKQAKIP